MIGNTIELDGKEYTEVLTEGKDKLCEGCVFFEGMCTVGNIVEISCKEDSHWEGIR